MTLSFWRGDGVARSSTEEKGICRPDSLGFSSDCYMQLLHRSRGMDIGAKGQTYK